MSSSKRGREGWDVVEMAGAGSVDTARVLMLLAQQYQHHHHAGMDAAGAAAAAAAAAAPSVVAGGRVFKCKTCSRQFPTFQALGGHRASHKRPRLPPPQQQQHELGLGLQTPPPAAAAKPRVHECPVCGLEFAIGQALGGHMRRHRSEAEAAPGKACDDVGGICLDLNLTPSENCAKCRNVVGLGGAAGQGVHKALAMLDCSL